MRRGKGGRNGLLPSSLRIISSCLKTVSSNAGTVASTVRSASASVAASIAPQAEDEKDQVLWAGFDKLELHPSSFKHVLLVGYSNGFQVLDVEDAANVCELVSKRDGPVTFLQMQPTPVLSEGTEGFRASHPMLLVVAGDETNGLGMVQGGRLSALIRDNSSEAPTGNCISTPTVVRFYSMKSHSYVHVLRFRSAVYIVRCSPRIVAVALAAQVYCFDAVTLENKFSVLTYPLQGAPGVNIGYGPMAVGPRWLAYASNSPLLSSTGRLSPQNLTPSPGVSPSTSPSSGSLVARYAMESSKHIAAGIINLGDMGYKTLSKYCQELLPDGSGSPLSSSPGRRSGKLPSSVHPLEADNAGMVVIKDFISKEIISQFRAHASPISALCFDPSGTLLVTASVHGHNINVFRIMPTLIANGSGSVRYDWTVSHVHLYKLYRGMTAAVIQDISFSHFSQWISIVSSRGSLPVPSKANALEHLLVYSPSGHVIQHELLPSSGSESSNSSPIVGPGSLQIQDDELHVTAEPIQWWDVCRRTTWPERDENIANIVFHNHLNSMMAVDASDCDSEHSDSIASDGMSGKDIMRARERSSWYLSNAEVHISSWRIPIWQKSKIFFYVMDQTVAESGESVDYSGGEIEIEKLPLHEVELRRRELLPVFKQFHYEQNFSDRKLAGTDQIYESGWSNVYFIVWYFGASVSGTRKTDNMNGLRGQLFSGLITAVDFRPMEKFNSVESPKLANLTALHNVDDESINHVSTTPGANGSAIMPQARERVDCVPSNIRPLNSYSLLDGHLDDALLSPASNASCRPQITNNSSVSNGVINDLSNGSLASIKSGQNETSDSHNSVEFTQYFQEGYCKISELDDCRELTEAVTDADSSSSHCEREKPEEDGDNDDMLGGVFAFSEEG
ncbi:hypothetical protein GUJ93_ZPchr0005g15336 [Zizania palustris]|uniref:BCAS3 domain-containing protein n=1 Tax=Zizania palustris TaxID=103762 RepID=A0A8J5SBW2_ZIZPA|nr:hypothetical protein GUJ93_ZPchr0005g15336 [Zizania palustris]